MKFFATTLALVALAASPVFAAPRHISHRDAAAMNSADQAYAAYPGYGSDTVFDNGQYLGRDPDPNVRLELMRDQSVTGGN